MFEGVIDTLKAIHGETIVYKGDGALSHSFTGVFDETHVEVNQETGLPVNSLTPSILLSLSDLPDLPRRDFIFEVRGQVYLVRNVEPDGKGAGRVFLSEGD